MWPDASPAAGHGSAGARVAAALRRAGRLSVLTAAMALFSALPVVADSWYEHYARAEKALTAGSWAEAVRELNEAIARKGDSGSRARTYGMRFMDYFPYLKLGRAYFELGQLDAALQACETEEQLGEVRRSVAAGGELRALRLEIEASRQAAAATAAERVRQIVDENLAQAHRLEDEGRLEDALAAWGRVRAVAPETPELAAETARLRRQIAQRETQRQRAERLAGLVDEGRRLLAAKRWSEAAQRFREALAESDDPRLEALLQQAQTALRDALMEREDQEREVRVVEMLRRARELETTGDLAVALERLEDVLALDPENRDARQLQQRLLSARALREEETARRAAIARLLATATDELADGRAEQALAAVNRLLAAAPGHREALEVAGRAYRAISRALLGAGERQNLPPAIRFADFRDQRADGSLVEQVGRADFRLSGVVIDDAPAEVAFYAGGVPIAAETQSHQVGESYLTEFNLHHRLPPGLSDFRLEAQDPEGLRSAGVYAVFYHRPFYLSPWFAGACAAIAIGAAAAGLRRRFRRRRGLLRRRFNPYVAGPPVLDPDLFLGREALLERILQTIHNNSLLLYGERRIGKTSIQHQLRRRLSELRDPSYDFYPVFIDLQGTPEEKFFSTLGEEVFSELEPHLDELRQSSAERYGYRELVRDLRRIFALLEEKGPRQPKLVLLIDEVDELNGYDPKINQRLRSLFMKSFAENLVAVVSGVAIERTWHRETSPWYNFFEEMEVRPLREDDARQLIERPIRGVFQLEAGAAERILERTGGKPYLIQKMCMALVYRLYEEGRKTITTADVDAAGQGS